MSISERPPASAGIERLRETLVPLQGLALTPSTWERDVLVRRLGAYSPTWLDALCVSGEVVWVGAGALGRTDGRVALYFRQDADALGPPQGRTPAPEDELHRRIRDRLHLGACFFTDLLSDMEGPSPQAIHDALFDLVWAGEVTNDSFAVLRAGRPTPARLARLHESRSRRSGSRFASRRSAAGASHPPGRWSLTESLFAGPASHEPAVRRRAIAELLLERYGVLTRELVLSEGIEGGFAALYPELSRLETVGAARRGYFVEGLGGAQFALPGAVERLRDLRMQAPAGVAARTGHEHGGHESSSATGVSPARQGSAAHTLVLAATDPAQPYGAALPWPRQARRAGRGPARVPGAYLVLVDWMPVLYLERGGRRLLTLTGSSAESQDSQGEPPRVGVDERLETAILALVAAAREGRIAKLAIERMDGQPVLGSPIEAVLTGMGFMAGPRRLTLRT